MARLDCTRADMVLAWLDAHPEGGNAKDIRAGLPSCHLSTVQKLMSLMREQGEVTQLGAGAHLRYCAHRHIAAAQAHAKILIAAATDKRRAIAEQRVQELYALDQRMRAHGTSIERAHQVVVREWPTPRKPGACSVFDLAEGA